MIGKEATTAGETDVKEPAPPQNASASHQDVARNILLSWLVTLPCAAATGALVHWLAAP